MNKIALKRLEKRKQIGRENLINLRSQQRLELLRLHEENAQKVVSKIKFDLGLYKVLGSVLFATEGGKFSDSLVVFINSDPRTIATFIRILREAFNADPKKFRALVHIHEYHNEGEIKEYWSKITGIPESQFYKSYLKPHTKKRIRKGYMGTISVRYYDYQVALELRWIYNILTSKIGGVV